MEMPDGSTLYDLIVLKRWKLVPMSTRINGVIIGKNERNATLLESGQNIHIMPFFGGG